MSSPLFSWGLYPAAPQTAHGCTWKSEVPQQLDCLNSEFGSTLAYGNGRSYGDSCLADSDHVLHMRTLNRFIEVDWQRGVVTAEAGITLAEILAVAIPRGWFLPVTPGTQFATLGARLPMTCTARTIMCAAPSAIMCDVWVCNVMIRIC